MRFVIGWVCVALIVAAVVVGVAVPTFGAGASLGVDLIALSIYLVLFYGIFWGFGGEHGRLR